MTIHAQPTFGYSGSHAQNLTKELYGGKGYGLLTMTQAGLNVPEAMVLTTDAWRFYRKNGMLSPATIHGIADMLATFPNAMFSVRSGAPVSMPGMMDTVLNVGATPETDATRPGAFRRFALAWLEIVKGVDKETTSVLMERLMDRERQGGSQVPFLLNAVLSRSGHEVPTNPMEQVIACVEAVFRSWDTPRAVAYRKMHNIAESMGTGCIIQRMVMGTAPGLSGSGVMFSRDPATGLNNVVGELAFNAQGEEVVNGSVTPMNLSDLAHSGNPQWEALHGELCTLADKLELAYGDVQDVEFTVESGVLYVLQTRTAKMSAAARIITACDLAMSKPPEDRLEYLKARVSKATVEATKVAKVATHKAPDAVGLAASPGAVSGKIVFRSTPLKLIDKSCILVALDTAPEDFSQMAASGGILTSTGGFTCHSAVVARGIGVPAVVGCDNIAVNHHTKTLKIIGGVTLSEGDTITIDGATGRVWAGTHKVTVNSPPPVLFDTLYALAGNSMGVSPDEVWWQDTPTGARCYLTLPLGNLDVCESQILRAQALIALGKQVALSFSMVAPDEDLVPPNPTMFFQPLADIMGPELKGMLFVPNLASAYAKTAMRLLGVKPITSEDGVVIHGNLTDLLGNT